MTDRRVLAIDQGTTNTKVTLVGTDGAIRSSASRRVPVYFPRPGWVESDPLEVWGTVMDAIAECLARAADAPVDAVVVTNQRESVIAWDLHSGAPLTPLVSWQCRRSTPACTALREGGYEYAVTRATGLRLDPMFSASKMRWLLDSIDDGQARAEGGHVALGTVDSWIVWNLTQGAVFATDLTNASRTMLLDIESAQWCAQMLELFDIPMRCLAEVRPSTAEFGQARLELAGGRQEAPIRGVAGDSHAALIGHRALSPGSVKVTVGTGTSVMAPVDGPLRSDVLSTTIGWSTAQPAVTVYALEGNIYATGAALVWTAELLGLGENIADLEAIARTCNSTDGVSFVPALTGLGAPHWNADARGTLGGLTRGSARPQISRAAFESVAHQIADVVDELRRVSAVDHLCTDGGATRSDLAMSLIADLAGVPVRRADTETIAMGALALASVSAGWWTELAELQSVPMAMTWFEPMISTDDRASRRARWSQAVRATLTTAT